MSSLKSHHYPTTIRPPSQAEPHRHFHHCHKLLPGNGILCHIPVIDQYSTLGYLLMPAKLELLIYCVGDHGLHDGEGASEPGNDHRMLPREIAPYAAVSSEAFPYLCTSF